MTDIDNTENYRRFSESYRKDGGGRPRGNSMTTDRALELAEAVFHELRRGNQPYLRPDEIEDVLRVLNQLRTDRMTRRRELLDELSRMSQEFEGGYR